MANDEATAAMPDRAQLIALGKLAYEVRGELPPEAFWSERMTPWLIEIGEDIYREIVPAGQLVVRVDDLRWVLRMAARGRHQETMLSAIEALDRLRAMVDETEGDE